MALRVKLTIDFEEANEVFNYLEGLFSSGDLLDGIGPMVVGFIQNRTMSGSDVEGNFFAPYSEKYEKHLSKIGEDTRVDLYFTGQMLGDLDYDVISTEVLELYFVSGHSAEIAEYHQQGTPKMPQRKFLGISDDEFEKIQDFFKTTVERS